MKMAVISDTHFGDPSCALVTRNNGQFEISRPQFNTFVDSIKEGLGGANTSDDDEALVKYLVLLGDVFDLSLVSYRLAIKATMVFLEEVQKHRVAKEIIFVPGNHDADLWHLLEYEVNVINPLRERRSDSDLEDVLPRELKGAVPGIIDDRSGDITVKLPGSPDDVCSPWPRGKLFLDGVTVDLAKGGGTVSLNELEEHKYGKTYLENLTVDDGDKEALTINVAHPNLYVIDETEGKYNTTILTHGHYFQAPWNLTGKLLSEIKNVDFIDPLFGNKHSLPINTKKTKDLSDINHPITQLMSTGMGQAGRLSAFVRAVHDEKKNIKLKYEHNKDAYRESLFFDLLEGVKLSLLGKTDSWAEKAEGSRYEKIIINLVYLLVKFVQTLPEEDERNIRWLRRYSQSLASGIRIPRRGASSQMKRIIHFLTEMGHEELEKMLCHDTGDKPSRNREIKRYFQLAESELTGVRINSGWHYRSRDGAPIPFPRPTKLIYGHTHRPIGIDVARDIQGLETEEKPLLVNCGSWTARRTEEHHEFLGAEVLVYTTERGWKSVSVPAEDLDSE